LLAGIEHGGRDEGVSNGLIGVAAKKVPTKSLAGVVMEIWKVIQGSEESVSHAVTARCHTANSGPTLYERHSRVNELKFLQYLKSFFHLLRQTLRQADRPSLQQLTKPIFTFFLDVFDLRHRLGTKAESTVDIESIEDSAIGSFLELVTKMNEGTFRPLFGRLYDWAVVDLAEGKGKSLEESGILMSEFPGEC